MNELERLIMNIDRPEPTSKLDACVTAILGQTQLRSSTPRWKNALVTCAVAACVGLLGFFAGRQSARSAPASFPAMARAVEPGPRNESNLVAASVTKVTLGENQLAGLLVRPDHREGLLGNGPVTVLTSVSP
jgi:hypothetical protein